MASLEELREERIKKIDLLRRMGRDPYPSEALCVNKIKRVRARFFILRLFKRRVVLAGRVMALRRHGGSVFIEIMDQTARIQCYFQKDTIGDDEFSVFVRTVDIGDFIKVKGTLFLTKKREKTVRAFSWKMLAKSVRPLPDKWHGLRDTEERYRKRYLELMTDPKAKDRFLVRTRIVSLIREYLDREGFYEVETPILHPIPGGASAAPFITHHNALDQDFYLRVSDELYLKRLLVAGLGKVYEIGRDFRNEGIDSTHNPEFTMLEYYEEYTDSEFQMQRVEELLAFVVRQIGKGDTFEYQGHRISWKRPLPRVTFSSVLERATGEKDILSLSEEQLASLAKKYAVSVATSDGRMKILDNIYKKLCRPKLISPTFIVDYPIEYLPLAKRKKGAEHLADAFQLVVGGIELVKAFSELNDPQDQRSRFLEQEKLRSFGDAEAQRIDEDFLTALEYGMPPAGGVGIGVDRLVMLLTNATNIREVILFPTLRSRNEGG